MHKDRVINDKSFFKKKFPFSIILCKKCFGENSEYTGRYLAILTFPTLYFLFHKKEKEWKFQKCFCRSLPYFYAFLLNIAGDDLICWLLNENVRLHVMQRTQPLDTKLKLKSIISSRNSNKKLVMQTFDRMSTESDIQLFIYIFRVLQNQKKY